MEKERLKEIKEETIDNNNKKEVLDNDGSNDQKERRCIKCNNLLSKDDKFCFICGSSQDGKTKKNNKKEKIKKINSNGNNDNKRIVSIIILVVVLLLGFWITLFIINYFDNSTNNVNTSNKNVTIDDTGIADAVSKVYDSVVVVENYINGSLYATGSGFVYKTDNSYGYILTNSHVITNATSIKVAFTSDENKKIDVQVVGSDEYSEVADIKVAQK